MTGHRLSRLGCLLGVIATTLTAPASAEDDSYAYLSEYGAPFPPDADNYTIGLVKNANRHPNATRSVRFTPFGGASNESSDDSEWTWRVNVTDFSVPNAAGIVSNGLHFADAIFVDPQVVNTVTELIWSGGTNVSEALNGSHDPLCVTHLMTMGMPANVTNLYTDDDTKSTDCTPMLSSSCVSAITSTVKHQVSSGSSCASDDSPWVDLPECADTLGYIGSQAPDGAIGTVAQRLSSFNPDGDWGAMSTAFNGTNTTTYELAVNLLQIMMITRYDADGKRQADAQLLCMRVNTSHLDATPGNTTEGDDDDDDGGTGTAATVYLRGDLAVAALVFWMIMTVGF